MGFQEAGRLLHHRALPPLLVLIGSPFPRRGQSPGIFLAGVPICGESLEVGFGVPAPSITLRWGGCEYPPRKDLTSGHLGARKEPIVLQALLKSLLAMWQWCPPQGQARGSFLATMGPRPCGPRAAWNGARQLLGHLGSQVLPVMPLLTVTWGTRWKEGRGERCRF